MTVVKYGNKILRTQGEKVVNFDKHLKSIATKMLETMKSEGGIGLAAQQFGLSIKIAVIDLSCYINFSDSESEPMEILYDSKIIPPELIFPLYIVNPTIKDLGDDWFEEEEGCLSFPGIREMVARPNLILVKFQDLEGNAHTLKCSGLLARCIQHETDHLNGCLIIDHWSKKVLKERKLDLEKIKESSRNESDFA